MLVYTATFGAHIGALSHAPSEAEILTPRDTAFVVHRVEQKDDIHYIHMEPATPTSSKGKSKTKGATMAKARFTEDDLKAIGRKRMEAEGEARSKKKFTEDGRGISITPAPKAR